MMEPIRNNLINGSHQLILQDLEIIMTKRLKTKKTTVERKELMPRNKTLKLVTTNSMNKNNFNLLITKPWNQLNLMINILNHQLIQILQKELWKIDSHIC